ncbi:MAG: hypothetical protein ACOYL3_06280 [Desulfuromonadaceae bacterium]
MDLFPHPYYIGGSLVVESVAGTGTVVMLLVPIQQSLNDEFSNSAR